MAGLGAIRWSPLVRLARLGIGAVFIAAALAKIGDIATFALNVHNFRIVPIWSENLVATTLPWIELVLGLALVTGIRARAGAVLGTALMAVFVAAVGQALVRGLDIECGCFGTADATRVGLTKLAENAALTVAAAYAALRLP